MNSLHNGIKHSVRNMTVYFRTRRRLLLTDMSGDVKSQTKNQNKIIIVKKDNKNETGSEKRDINKGFSYTSVIKN